MFPSRDSHLHCRTMEEKHVLLLFQSAMIHGKVIHVNFFPFFPAIFVGPQFVEI